VETNNKWTDSRSPLTAVPDQLMRFVWNLPSSTDLEMWNCRPSQGRGKLAKCGQKSRQVGEGVKTTYFQTFLCKNKDV